PNAGSPWLRSRSQSSPASAPRVLRPVEGSAHRFGGPHEKPLRMRRRREDDRGRCRERVQAWDRSDAEPSAALGAAGGDYFAPADRLHAATKSVIPSAAKLRGLKCAFHGCKWAAFERPGRVFGLGER